MRSDCIKSRMKISYNLQSYTFEILHENTVQLHGHQMIWAF